ncbi:transporter substrate-binding domain-containing protein [Bosea sp. BK604]|uniref:transporter substrate-binding domain-containing protein n=1 Tax=Bosea sp. BK604 TaxID=2512180 RepID=UPI001044A3CA|nr:transporter substrate-binding domain-containing protein [Bosea sp. BK604]TCR67127.1 amino acid ABC transporter substrate-binding protein (PAAT family) [Bosea sp. BK604]
MSLFKSICRRSLGALVFAGLAAASLGAPANAATPEEIKARGKLIVGLLTDYPPFGGTDAQQQPAGYDADVAKLMAKSLGVQAELVPVTGPNRIPYLLTNKVDVLIATFGITAERSKQVLFSNPYSTLTIYVLAPKNLTIKTPEDLKSVSISVARASTQDTAISAIAPQGTQLKRFDDDATALQALISGQVQAMGASNTILAQLNKDYAQLNMEPKLTLREQANGMAFRKSDTALAAYANNFIAEIEKNGELSAINQRWFGIPLNKLPPMPTF